VRTRGSQFFAILCRRPSWTASSSFPNSFRVTNLKYNILINVFTFRVLVHFVSFRFLRVLKETKMKIVIIVQKPAENRFSVKATPDKLTTVRAVKRLTLADTRNNSGSSFKRNSNYYCKNCITQSGVHLKTGRINCFSMQIVMNKSFLLNPEKNLAQIRLVVFVVFKKNAKTQIWRKSVLSFLKKSKKTYT